MEVRLADKFLELQSLKTRFHISLKLAPCDFPFSTAWKLSENPVFLTKRKVYDSGKQLITAGAKSSVRKKKEKTRAEWKEGNCFTHPAIDHAAS